MTKPTTTIHRVTKAINSSTDDYSGYNPTQNATNTETIDRKTISKFMAPIMQSFHEQFKQHLEIQHENELAREIRQMYCHVSVLRRLQAVTLSQTNGLLAASVLELPTCSRLQGLGESLLLQEFERVQVFVTAKETKFGYQPLTVYNNKNYTIGTDGWSIHPFSNCFWKSNFVNLNGKTYHWEHNVTYSGWVEQIPTIHTPNLNLVSEFQELPLNDFDYALKGHPAHSTADMENLNVLTELIGRIEETHDNSLSGMIMSEKRDSRIGEMFSWTDYLKIIIFSTIGFVMFILLMYIFARVNPFPALVDSFQRKRLERKNQLDTEGVPLEQLQPMIASAPQVIIPGDVYPYVVNLSAPIDRMPRPNSFLNRIQL
ncbi:hypothetical protein DAPPUDRAFT_335519 [Daphnia pulex]|uniref:Uncharacterized protein n=1 Tax=Daphnia pulex TaxID=6669 RepID=E9HXY5_DAPPU|nr:hypothetical protein DAPPUDRAFT_335519 [Daphnia pulex]|eukprot:EFX63395.1 hypothetical protein DAPPUDRAFT_335519 [Daphnia pulex]